MHLLHLSNLLFDKIKMVQAEMNVNSWKSMKPHITNTIYVWNIIS